MIIVRIQVKNQPDTACGSIASKRGRQRGIGPWTSTKVDGRDKESGTEA